MTDLLDKGFSAAYFFSVHHIEDFLPFLSGLPSFKREISHESYRCPFICEGTFTPCCFQNFLFILVFCQFHYDMSCRRSIQVMPEGSSLCLLDFNAFFLPQIREVLSYDLFKYAFRPFLSLFLFWNSYYMDIGTFDSIT